MGAAINRSPDVLAVIAGIRRGRPNGYGATRATASDSPSMAGHCGFDHPSCLLGVAQRVFNLFFRMTPPCHRAIVDGGVDICQRRSVVALDSTSTPPLLVLHGRQITGADIRRWTRLDAVADQQGFIVAYPEGYQRSWNDGRGNSPAELDGVDDVAFVGALLDRLIGAYPVAVAQVAVTGLSNGGVKCHRLALELSERIAVIAPFAGSMPLPLASMQPAWRMRSSITATCRFSTSTKRRRASCVRSSQLCPVAFTMASSSSRSDAGHESTR